MSKATAEKAPDAEHVPAPAPLSTVIKVQDKTRGMPKSGRPWKDQVTRRSSAKVVRNRGQKHSYERRMIMKRERQEMRERQRALDDRIRAEKRAIREKKRAKQLIKEENEKKSSVVQEIKDVSKIKRMGKKALRYIQTRDTVAQRQEHRKKWAPIP